MSQSTEPSSNAQDISTVEVLGTSVHALTAEQVLGHIHEAIRVHRRVRIGVVNAAKLVNMKDDPELNHDVASSDLVLADGMSVVWASRLGSASLPERIAGIDLMHSMMRTFCSDQLRVYFLGASEAVNTQVAERAIIDYPGLVVAGRHHGYFGEEDEEALVQAINSTNAQALFVAMSSPMKERFMARNESKLNVPIIHGVGGSFDVYAGKVSRAPLFMQKLGLEWLHRVIQEPQRMWRRYLVTNSQFVWLVIRDWLRS